MWRRTARAAAGLVLAVGLGLVGAAVPVGTSGAVTAHRPPPAPGYRLLGGDGGVFSFGSSTYHGSLGGDPTACPADPPARSMPGGSCWSMATTPDDQGYLILNAYNGAITAEGTATTYGSPYVAMPDDMTPDFIGITLTPDARGYWVLERGLSGFGTVKAFGDAVSYGDESTPPATPPVGGPVAMDATPTGLGYWIVDSDGRVSAFGDAVSYGSMAGKPLNEPVVGMAATRTGLGYWLVAADGGVFAFGDAVFGGSMGGTPLNAPVVGMAADPFGPGYWLAAADGGVFALGGAQFEGSMGGTPLNRPVFAISTARPQPV